MVRPSVLFALAVSPLLIPLEVGAQPSSSVAPSRYELMINGESFVIDLNRMTTLKSQETPGVEYKVALRVAPTQQFRLGSVEFDYDWLTRLSEDARQQRTVRLTHELGVEMLITDWGEDVDAATQAKILETLSKSVAETLRGQNFQDIKVTGPEPKKFTGTSGQAMVIHYQDQQQAAHTCWIYLLNGPKFTVSCMIQYMDADLTDVKDLVKKTLNSFRPAK